MHTLSLFPSFSLLPLLPPSSCCLTIVPSLFRPPLFFSQYVSLPLPLLSVPLLLLCRLACSQGREQFGRVSTSVVGEMRSVSRKKVCGGWGVCVLVPGAASPIRALVPGSPPAGPTAGPVLSFLSCFPLNSCSVSTSSQRKGLQLPVAFSSVSTLPPLGMGDFTNLERDTLLAGLSPGVGCLCPWPVS